MSKTILVDSNPVVRGYSAFCVEEGGVRFPGGVSGVWGRWRIFRAVFPVGIARIGAPACFRRTWANLFPLTPALPSRRCAILRHTTPHLNPPTSTSPSMTRPQNVQKVDLWDTAGQEKYRGLAPMYCKLRLADRANAH